MEVVAWYTTSIPVKAGPEIFNQLPGAILEINIDNYSIEIKAIEYRNKIEKSDFVISKKAELISKTEYERLIFEEFKYKILH